MEYSSTSEEPNYDDVPELIKKIKNKINRINKKNKNDRNHRKTKKNKLTKKKLKVQNRLIKYFRENMELEEQLKAIKKKK